MRLEDLAPAGIAFVVVGIVLGIGADVLTDISEGQAAGTGKDATLNATAGVGELASWMPTIALVVAAAIIIGIVVTYFVYRR